MNIMLKSKLILKKKHIQLIYVWTFKFSSKLIFIINKHSNHNIIEIISKIININTVQFKFVNFFFFYNNVFVLQTIRDSYRIWPEEAITGAAISSPLMQECQHNVSQSQH